jgi:hypothetical protein
MAKYQKKPIVIEATQWFPGLEIEGVITTKTDSPSRIHGEIAFSHTVSYIQTLEGKMYVNPGDYIITGVKGDYPCKPDIFEATYEAV